MKNTVEREGEGARLLLRGRDVGGGQKYTCCWKWKEGFLTGQLLFTETAEQVVYRERKGQREDRELRENGEFGRNTVGMESAAP